MEYNEKLKELRIKNNMSQEQLAEKLNGTRQTVSKWEQGINQPDIYTLKQYSIIFKVSLDDLIDDNAQFKSPKYIRRKASRILFLLSTLLYIFCVMLVFILLRFVQGRIPMHWDMQGHADRYANKIEILIHLLPLTAIYLTALITYIVGKKKSWLAIAQLNHSIVCSNIFHSVGSSNLLSYIYIVRNCRVFSGRNTTSIY